MDLLFKKKQELNLELGFGRGLFIKQWATKNPNKNIIGIEVRKQMIKELRLKYKEKTDNLKLIHGNGIKIIQSGFKNNSIDKVFILHPDPWFKNKHKKRRIINPENLDTLKKKIKMNGKLYISTDVKSLWESFNKETLKSGLRILENDPFWKKNYLTHWSEYIKKTNKKHYYATFIST